MRMMTNAPTCICVAAMNFYVKKSWYLYPCHFINNIIKFLEADEVLTEIDKKDYSYHCTIKFIKLLYRTRIKTL